MVLHTALAPPTDYYHRFPPFILLQTDERYEKRLELSDSRAECGIKIFVIGRQRQESYRFSNAVGGTQGNTTTMQHG